MHLEAQFLNALGALEQDDFQTAKQGFEAIIQAIDLDSTQEEDEALIGILATSHLSTIFARHEQVEDALKLAHRAVALTEVHEFDSVPEPYNNLASVLVLSGHDLQEPVRLWKKVLSIERTLHGEKALPVASVLQDLGVAYRYMDDTAQAIDVAVEALEIYETHEPAWSFPCVLQRLHLMSCYDEAQMLEKSTQHLDAIFALFEEAPADNETWLTTTLPVIAGTFSQQGRCDESDWIYGYLLEQIDALGIDDEVLIEGVQEARAQNEAFKVHMARVEQAWLNESQSGEVDEES